MLPNNHPIVTSRSEDRDNMLRYIRPGERPDWNTKLDFEELGLPYGTAFEYVLGSGWDGQNYFKWTRIENGHRVRMAEPNLINAIDRHFGKFNWSFYTLPNYEGRGTVGLTSSVVVDTRNYIQTHY